jgi:hypothetical protein
MANFWILDNKDADVLQRLNC